LKRIFKIIFKGAVYLFALVGLVLVGGFFAIRLHLTDVKGSIDSKTEIFQKNNQTVKAIESPEQTNLQTNDPAKSTSIEELEKEIERLSSIKQIRQVNYCRIEKIGKYFPQSAKHIIEIAKSTQSDPIVFKMTSAVSLSQQANSQFMVDLNQCDQTNQAVELDQLSNTFFAENQSSAFAWMNTEQWSAIREAVIKDKDVIELAAQQSQVEPRMIVACMIGEQVRLFNSQRELFKKFFQPLKILGNSNKISLGVMGIKETTATDIEKYLKDQGSQFYLGKDFENLLDFKSQDVSSERYARLTNEKDHYYSYLYGGLYIKEISKQWRNAGFDITYRPEIVGTLFNVGFAQSKPKPDPQVGGSQIRVGDSNYSFGSLVYEFYYSGELACEFPYVIN
jgi:hypothetical protein